MNARLPVSYSTQTRHSPTLSILIPVYNEIEVLPLCLERLGTVLTALDYSHEIIFVDDGSRDGSADWLAAYVCSHDHLKLIRLSRNFGKEAAMSAGLQHCSGEATIILDADLQDPPELVPDMLAAWRAGADVVAMRRRSRAGEPWHKKLSAHLYYRLLGHLSNAPIPPDTGDFRLLSRRAVQALNQLPERTRYMKGLFAWVGFPTTVMFYDRAPRAAGTTKWGYRALLALALEGITSFSVRPLRWTAGLGAVTATAGLAYGAFIAIKTVMLGEAVQGYPSLVAIMSILGGAQLIALGLLGEYVGKTYIEAKQRPLFLVRDILQSPPAYARQHTEETHHAHA